MIASPARRRGSGPASRAAPRGAAADPGGSPTWRPTGRGCTAHPGPSAARDAALAARIEQLTATGGRRLAARRRTTPHQHDLHDQAQARLIALSMRIGLARRAADSDPATARKLLDDAQDQAEALAELRHVVRGIHPPILTDRGLTGAVRAWRPAVAWGDGDRRVAGRGDGDADGPGRRSRRGRRLLRRRRGLTNAAKHSGATRASVLLARYHGLRRRAGRGPGGAEAGTSGGSSCSACAARSPRSTGPYV